jgi:hypothetical protein
MKAKIKKDYPEFEADISLSDSFFPSLASDEGKQQRIYENHLYNQ